MISRTRIPPEASVSRSVFDAAADADVVDPTADLTPPDRSTEFRDFLQSTPGRLGVLGLVLIVIALFSAALISTANSDRQHELDGLLRHTEPLTNAAQNLYSALSIADAAATTGFLSGGIEPASVRKRYSQALGDASTALVTAANGFSEDDSEGQRLLAEIGAALPVYAGLVESARANNRVGYPVGAAYLSEASALMQQKLLPQAEQLYTEQSDEVSRTQTSTSRLPWGGIALVLLVLLALCLAQRYVSTRSRRTLNTGLILASAAIIVALSWLTVAGFVSASHSDHSRSSGSEPLADLARARILAQQARSDETLGLVRRGDAARFETVFNKHLTELYGLLHRLRESEGRSPNRERIDQAVTATTRWGAVHQEVNRLLTVGSYTEAVKVAVGDGEGNGAPQFEALDGALRGGIDETREELRSGLNEAHASLAVLTPGILVLSVLCAIAISAGLWPRLSEYQ